MLVARDDTEESEFLRKIATDLLAPGVVRNLIPECWDFAAESVVPTEVLDRIDVASTSVPRRLRSGVRVQVELSAPSRLRLPSEEGETTGDMRVGRRWRLVRVLSSSPLNASKSLRPSASTNSISVRISFAL